MVYLLREPKKPYFFLLRSTCEILVMPALLAALSIPMFTLRLPIIPQNFVTYEASPHLLPTGFEVAAMGVVIEEPQLVRASAQMHAKNSFFIITISFVCRYLVWSATARHLHETVTNIVNFFECKYTFVRH